MLVYIWKFEKKEKKKKKKKKDIIYNREMYLEVCEIHVYLILPKWHISEWYSKLIHLYIFCLNEVYKMCKTSPIYELMVIITHKKIWVQLW